VDHLVCQHPVVVELGNRRFLADRDSSISVTIRKGRSTVNAGSAAYPYIELHVRDGKLAVIGANGFARPAYPRNQLRAGSRITFAIKVDVDRRAANFHGF